MGINVKNKRYTIAIMLGDTQSDYSEDLLRGFYTCAKEEDINILFLMGPQTPLYCKDILSCSIDGDYNYQFDTIYDYVHFTKPDALIITYGSLSIFNNDNDKERFLKQYENIPYLVLEDTPDGCDAPYLIADNYHGMKACIEHLIVDHGYRNIAFLSGPRNNRDACERLEAYYDTMAANGIPVTDTMVTYGNYSELVNDQVEFLLDNNTGLEAIACANDNMAKACYRICAARDLLIGSDIAITGFDDVELARTMEPPLTSVSHSSFQFSYTALKNAIMLCEGKKPVSQRMPAVLHKRASCGCPSAKITAYSQIAPGEMETFILKAVGSISLDLLSCIPYKKDRDLYGTLILDFFHYIYLTVVQRKGKDFRMEYLLGILKQFTSYQHLSSVLLLDHFSDLLRVLASNMEDEKIQKMLTSIIVTTQQYIHSNDILILEKEIVDSNRKAWFVPSFTRDLVAVSNDLRFIYMEIMKRLRMMNVKSSYFYFFDEPIIHKEREPLCFPKNIYLTAYHTEHEMVYYDFDQRPCITYGNGFSNYIEGDHPCCLTAFILFSGTKQYGLLLCEVNQENISFMQICSLQIGSLLRFIELNALERESQAELQSSLKVIQEQNHILSFISEYDELSKLLNRRGFMERALQTMEQQAGKTAYLIFGDLDHLKEINDCFGHAAGDYAIKQAANRLLECLPGNSIIARIGGDEFVSLVLSDAVSFRDSVFDKLKEAGDTFNANSEKPYYIDLSVGILEFFCSPQIDLNEIIQQADDLLYQAKAKRRTSIKKIRKTKRRLS